MCNELQTRFFVDIIISIISRSFLISLELHVTNRSHEQIVVDPSTASPNTKTPKQETDKTIGLKSYLSHEEIEIVDSMRNSTVHISNDKHSHTGKYLQVVL